ncbi:hypothetical protein ACIQK6_03780 [Streptomyces sp. NPDC091682]|uniref:hypothetical protein n=1 Tax=Streptomyces sp. NPDC091682 TaxID=3366005 RepID=UPI0038246A07
MPAVRLGGQSRFREEAGGGDRSVSGLEVVPRLAEALALVPPRPATAGRTALGVLLVPVSIATFLVGSLAGKWFADGPGAELLLLGWISAFALLGAILLIATSVRTQRAFRARIAAGRDAAEEVWSRGWCCARCTVVHRADGPAMTLQEFRRAVWSAGGCGELAEVHRVSGTTAAPGY